MLLITRSTGEKLPPSDGHGCIHGFVEQMSQGATCRRFVEPRLKLCGQAAGDDESLEGGFGIQFGRPENRGVGLEAGVHQVRGNLLHAVPVAGERQLCIVSICAV